MMQIEENGHHMGFLRKFMMENAGASAVRRLDEKFENLDSKNILIFAGLGNNGGDAFVIARHLAGHGSKVTVVLLLDLIRNNKIRIISKTVLLSGVIAWFVWFYPLKII